MISTVLFNFSETIWKIPKKTTIGKRDTAISLKYFGSATANNFPSSIEFSTSETTSSAALPSVWYKSPRIRTAKIGPMEHRATSPKLSSPACLSLRMDAIPTPNAIIKGTVIGPVVTPPESNATARKFSETNMANTNTKI